MKTHFISPLSHTGGGRKRAGTSNLSLLLFLGFSIAAGVADSVTGGQQGGDGNNTPEINSLMAPAADQHSLDPIAYLFKMNRDVKSAEFSHQSALEAVKVAGTLPDPVMESSAFISPIETRNGPMEGQFMLGQKYPLWGKLKRDRKISMMKAEIAGHDLEQTRISVAFQVYRSWTQWERLRNSLEILGQYKSELESFRNVALTQYSTGTGLTQHPILKLQIEMSLIESQINNFQSELESVLNDLQSLYDGNFSTDLFSRGLDLNFPSPSPEIWMEKAEKLNPIYQKVQRGYDIATLQEELAVRSNYPDLVTGLTYTAIGPVESPMASDPGSDALGVKVGLNLPIWFKRNKARVQMARFKVRSQQEIIAEIWNQIEDDIRSISKEWMEIDENYTLYESQLLGETEQMLSSAYSAYETGKIDFLDVLDSERMMVKVRLGFEMVKAQREIATAKMYKAVGLTRFNED